MTPVLVFVGVLLGLAIGSFANVVAYRLPAGRSILRPPSACPHCEHAIQRRDNVPVLGWILLRGRCRHCRKRISVRYPIVEVATAALFVLVVFAVEDSATLPAYWAFVGVTMVLILTDLDHKLIPNRILFPGTAISGGLLLVGSLLDEDLASFGRGLVGATAYFASLLALALVARGGFGFGDVKLAFLLGLFTGYLRLSFVVAAGMIAFIAGGLISILLLAFRIRGRKDAIPFGPYLVLASYVVIIAGPEIVDFYVA